MANDLSSDETQPSLSISSIEFETCIKVLSKFSANDGYPSIESPEFDRIRPLIHNLNRLGNKLDRQRTKDKINVIKSIDKKSKNSCLLRLGRAKNLKQLQLESVLVPDGYVSTDSLMEDVQTQTSKRLIKPKSCYICKLQYRTLHFFYDSLCPSCAKLNYEKREQTTDLQKHVALVTGGRVKIGYRIVLKLLRANCFVIATTRFPMDLLNRLSKEDDFNQWKDRVHIYGVDFRYSKLVELFTTMLIEKYNRLDFLINNACQTVQRPTEYYQHLFQNENLSNYTQLSNDQQNILEGNLQFYKQFLPLSYRIEPIPSSSPSNISLPLPSYIKNDSDTVEISSSSLISSNVFDVNQQPIDFRRKNSWTLRLSELSANEINDVLTINTLAPFILNSKLKIMMTRKHPDHNSVKFIINVSAMEGSFSRKNKTDRHPHTNAAKAALNMMTRTSAMEYKKSNIYMVSVDTGWINDENPLEKATRIMNNLDFQTPLDEEDAAARVLDPIIDTYKQLAEGKTDISIPYGVFLKDYSICDW